MNSVRWAAVLAALVMLLGAGLSHFGQPKIHLADRIGKPDLESMFPKQFGPWRVDTSQPIIIPSPDIQAALDAVYNQVLARTYIDREGRRVMLSVAYGGDQSDGTSAHRPEACYPAQGFDIVFNQKAVQPTGKGALNVRTLVARSGERIEPITYWVVVGDEVATTGVEQKLAQMRYGLRGVIADGMLVRVSTIDADRKRAYAVQSDFIVDLSAAMPAQARDRVFGKATR